MTPETLRRIDIPQPFDLGDFLRSNFLTGFYKDKPNYYRDIPGLTIKYLRPILTNRGVRETHLTGSVARCAVRGVPDDFWLYPDYFHTRSDEYDKEVPFSKSEQQEIVKDDLVYLAQGPADIDLKIRLEGQETSIDTLMQSSFRLDPKRAKNVESGRKSFDLNEHNFTVKLEWGPIPTNLARQAISIDLVDKKLHKKVFSIHVGQWPIEAIDAHTDKRIGATCDKQDFCTLPVVCNQGKIGFSIPDRAREVMNQPEGMPDCEDMKDWELSRFMEITLRALRINLVHPIEDLVNFDHFFPLFDDNTLWEIRKKVRDLYREQRELTVSEKKIIFREFIFCLTVDPYLTCQFFRDTGLGILIPGLSQASREDWQDLLISDSFSNDLGGKSRPAPHRLRGNDFIKEEREKYKRKVDKNGAFKFIDHLMKGRKYSRHLNHWILLAGLLYRKGRVSTLRMKDVHEMAGLKLVSGETIVVMGPDGEEIIGGPRLVVILRKALEEITAEQPRSKIHLNEDLVRELRLKDGTTCDKEILSGMIEALEMNRVGLTARELKHEVYNAESTNVQQTEQFKKQFLLLKLSGLIERRVISRLNKHGQITQAEFYFLREKRQDYNLTDLWKAKAFRQRFIGKWSPRDERGPVGRIINFLPRGWLTRGINQPLSLHVLQTLSGLDIELLNVRNGISWPFIEPYIPKIAEVCDELDTN